MYQVIVFIFFNHKRIINNASIDLESASLPSTVPVLINIHPHSSLRAGILYYILFTYCIMMLTIIIP
jgi:hypothetical protein